MKRFVALLVMFVMIGLLFLIGCSGSGTIPAGPSPGDSPLDPGQGISFDCAALEADIEAACGDDVIDFGSNLEGTLPHVICSRTFSTGDPNGDPFVEVFLRTHQSPAAQDLAWQPKEGARDASIGDGGYSYTEDMAYSDIDYLVVHKGLVTLQLKNVEWTRGTKPPAICTQEEFKTLASLVIARI